MHLGQLSRGALVLFENGIDCGSVFFSPFHVQAARVQDVIMEAMLLEPLAVVAFAS